MSVPAGDFVADTQVEPRAGEPGRFDGAIPVAWQIVDAFGGMIMSVALRAMQDELARPELRLVSANAMFVDRVPCGPVTIDVEVLRSGKRVAQVASRLRVRGNEGVALHTHAVFGIDHDQEHALQEVEFPDVPAPEECDPPPPQSEDDDDRGWGHVNCFDQNDWRPASGIAPWLPSYGKGEARMCSWVRLVKEPLLADGTHDPIALAFYADQIGSAVGQGLGPTDPHFMLTLELGVRFIAAPTTPWVLQDAEAWHVGDGYATGPTRLWGADRKLLAIATQTANLRFVNR